MSRPDPDEAEVIIVPVLKKKKKKTKSSTFCSVILKLVSLDYRKNERKSAKLSI